MIKIMDEGVIAEVADILEKTGRYKEAAHVRERGFRVPDEPRSKKSTGDKLQRYAELWRYYRQLRANGILKSSALKQCCEKFDLRIERGSNEGKFNLALAERIIDGKIPGVSQLRKQLDDVAEEETLRKIN